LQQSLRLLTLTNVELENALEAELEANPVLERDAASAELDTAPPPAPNVDWQAYFENAYPERAGYEPSEDFDAFANAPGPRMTLGVYLARQLEVSVVDPDDLELSLRLAAALDDNGYLRTPLSVLAEEMSVSSEELERVLTRVVQRLEPPGVGARNLRECLYLQWRRAGNDAPVAAGVIIDKYLEGIGRAAPGDFACAVGVTEAELTRALAFIRELEPRPGRAFGEEPNQALIPDVRVELQDGKVNVIVLDERVGRLYVSRYYRGLLRDSAHLDKATARFLNTRLRAAAWFIRAIHERRRTIEKVVAAIFARQRRFLVVGEAGLQPLIMEDIAAEVGVHVSTVSRAVAGKVVDTPRGIHPLKYFFTGALGGDDGDVSVARAKTLIQDIIEDEDKAEPLSDTELSLELARHGVCVARRTVAKYRRELKISGKYGRRTRI